MLLQNRAIDVWVHEQDIRRATNRPGGLDSTGARVTAVTFAAAMAYVLGKRVAPAAGMQVVWEITGPSGFTVSLRVGEDGRAAEQQDTADGRHPARDGSGDVHRAGGRSAYRRPGRRRRRPRPLPRRPRAGRHGRHPLITNCI